MRTGENLPRVGVARFDPRAVTIPLEPVGDDRTEPSAGWIELASISEMDMGVWDHTVGTSLHTEDDEVFVIVSGRVTVTEDGGDPVDFGPGDVGILTAGTKTAWIVHERVRKVWVARSSPPEDSDTDDGTIDDG